MATLFDLMDNLRKTINVIEENEGEVTEETAKEFAICSENFKEKCKHYHQMIRLLNNDLSLIKEESERLAKLKKIKEKSIEFLNTNLVKAIEEFGNTDKGGKKFLDYGDSVLSVKETKSVKENNDLIKNIVNQYMIDVKYFQETNQFSENDNFDISDFIDETKAKLNLPEDMNLTESDLYDIKVTTNIETTLGDLLKGKGYDLVSNIARLKFPYSFNGKLSKSEIKSKLTIDGDTLLAKIVTNKKAIIK